MDQTAFLAAISGGVDGKLATGLARQLGRVYELNSSEARSVGLSFCLKLIGANMRGARVAPSWFNVECARAAAKARANPAVLCAERHPMRLSRTGRLHCRSLRRATVTHFAAGHEFETGDWVAAVDDVGMERGQVSSAFWTPPVAFDHHVIQRYMLRGERRDGAAVAALLDGALAMASLYSAVAHTDEGVLFADAVFPARGGALCGGVDIVASTAWRDGYRVYCAEDGEPTFGFVTATKDVHHVLAVKTFMDEAILSPQQRAAVAEVDAWWRQWARVVLGNPLAAFEWTDDAGTAVPPQDAIEAFRPVFWRVQEAFRHWKDKARESGYGELDVGALAERFAVQPPDALEKASAFVSPVRGRVSPGGPGT